MKRLIWIMGFITLSITTYSQIDTIQNNESGLSVRNKLNATIIQVNSLTAGTATDSSFVSMQINTITEWSAGSGLTIDGTLIKDYTIAPHNGNPSQYITADADELSLYVASTEIIDMKAAVTTISNSWRPTTDGTQNNGAVGSYWQKFFTEIVQFSEQTAPAAPSVNTGVLYMDASNEHIYFQNSSTTYDLTTGTGAVSTDSLWVSITSDTVWSSGSAVWVEGISDILIDTISLGDIAPLLVDTIPLITFGGGSGNTGDDASFTTNSYYGSFYNGGSDTLVITELRGIVEGTSASVGVQIHWHADHGSASSTNLNSTSFTINSLTTGNSDVSFANYEIPPGVFVWCTTPTVSVAPLYMSITLMGHKK